MKIEKITEILESHGVPYYTENGKIYADSMESGAEVFERTEDITAWTKQELYEWLGY